MSIDTKLYKYSLFIEIVKMGMKFLSVILLVFITLTMSKYNPIYQTITERIGAVLGLTIAIFMMVFFTYNWSKIKVDNDALQVEFLWRWLRIEWENIDGILEAKTYFGTFGIWIIKSHKLTVFHRFYGFFSYGKLQPCILIYSYMNNYQELINKIKQHAS